MPDQPVPPIDATTRYCAVYGHPVRHSASPAMQNAGLAALGLNWRYLAFDVDPDQLGDALRGAQAMGFIGLNLTVPHKVLALELVDEVDPVARRWGAVNTIRFEGRGPDGRWQPLAAFTREIPVERRSVGFNTDANAIVRALHEEFDLHLAGRRVLVLGAGGAGRTAALRIAEEGPAEMTLINRTRATAEQVAREIRERHPGIQVGHQYPGGGVDLVLNATSLGLRTEDPLPVDQEWLRAQPPACFYDMIYRPAETPLLRLAGQLHWRTANGLSMLLHQGADALELWSAQPAPRLVMLRALEKSIYG